MENSWQRGTSGRQGDYGGTYTPCIDLSGAWYQENVSQQTTQYTEEGTNTQIEEENQGPAKRDKNYVNSEDEIICSAYLNVSRDPIVGVSQPMGAYWTRITTYFNEHRRTPIVRSLQSLQKRWGDIQKETSKFCGCYAEIQRRNQSGKSEDDKVKDALELYQGRRKGKQFKYIHCWFILRNEQKWNEYVAGLSSPSGTRAAAPPSRPAEAQPSRAADVLVTETAPERCSFERPIGRDRAKKQRNSSSSSNSSACYEMLQKMQLERAKFEEDMKAANKEESEAMSVRSDRKIALQEQQLAIQGQQLALQEKEREDRIMATDIDKVAPWCRQYYIDQQKTIAAKTAIQAAKAAAEAAKAAAAAAEASNAAAENNFL